MMREHQFRSTKMRSQVTPRFLRRLHQKWFFEKACEMDIAVDRDTVEEAAKLFVFARNNPQSPEARSLRYFFNAFDEKPAQSVSDAVVKDMMDYSAAKQLLELRFVDEASHQIEGGVPCISAFNEGHDGAVEEILLANFRQAAADGRPDAAGRVSMLEAKIWAGEAMQRVNKEVDAEVAALEGNFHAHHAHRRLG